MVSPAGEEAERWFSAFLGARCVLVRLSESSVRPLDPDYGSPEARVHPADAFPFLLISEASLADLNARLDRPLPINRLRVGDSVRILAPTNA